MKRDISVIKGNTIAFTMSFSDLEDTLTGAYFSAKDRIDDTEYAFQVTLGNGISQIDDTDKYLINVPPSMTKDLDVGAYYYDLTVVIGSNVYTLLYGILNVNPGVTDVPTV